MKTIFFTFVGAASLLIAPASFADMIYNPEHSETMKHLTAVESANLNLQYQCGEYSLFISSFATASELNGKNASVTGKITSKNSSHDISDMLSLAISRNDVLTGQISVGCNPEKGAFKLDISPSAYAKKEAGQLTIVEIFADGTVIGSEIL